MGRGPDSLALAPRPQAAEWLEDVIALEEVDSIVRWLKDASRTAALGRAVEKSRFLGVPRRRGTCTYERTESQQNMLEQLRALQRAKKGR